MVPDRAPYEIWNEIVRAFIDHGNKPMDLEELEDETGYEKRNIQLALYRAVRRGDVKRLSQGLYKYIGDDEFDEEKMYHFTSSKEIFIESDEYDYEIRIPEPSVRVLDEIIGQLKLIRNQIAHSK